MVDLPVPTLSTGIDDWLQLNLEGTTLVITLSRPQRRNAVTWDQVIQLARVLDRAANHDGVRAVVLTGAGDAFSAGGDVKDQAARHGWGIVERHRLVQALLDAIQAVWDFPKPLIAAITGVATGAGLGLALLCDIRLAATDARLGCAFVRVGLGPDYGVSYTLPRTVGPGLAARLLYTGTLIDAGEAQAIGLVEAIHPSAEVVPAALALAAEIAERAPFGVRLAKEGLRRSGQADLPTTLRTEMQVQFLAIASDDHREGTAAFAEKRPPQFTDR